MAKQRNSSLEVIRIICIFYVIFWHSINPFLDATSGANQVVVSLMNSLCNNTNTLFMLLSGYFGIRLNIEKLLKLDIAIIFYDVLYLLFFSQFSAKGLVTALMPITFKSHWFLTCYFVIAFLSGFLNMIPEKLDRKTFRNLLLLLIGIFYLLPTLVFYEVIEDGGKGVVCMSIVYLTGRYLKKYYGDVSFKKSRLSIVFWVLIIAATVLDLGLSFAKGTYMGMYARDNSIFMLLSSIACFLVFREMHFTNRLINHVTPNIVILYCVEEYARILTGKYIHLGDYVSSALFVPITVLYALGLIVILLLMNELRTLIFDKLDSLIAAQVMRFFRFVAQKCVRLGTLATDTASNFLIR